MPDRFAAPTHRNARRGALGLIASVLFVTPAHADEPETRLSVVVGPAQESSGGAGVDAAEVRVLRDRVSAAPRDRELRYELVRALMDGEDWDEALEAARDWRKHDAYDLVVVRLLGDIYREMGREDEALRVYSAVTELLPEDPEAQRALATVLKQRGDLTTAHGRLRRAVELRPRDHRIAFELADVELRLGRTSDAEGRLAAIVAADEVAEQIRYPATQRLAQVFAAQRREAAAEGRAHEAQRWQAKLDALEVKGGVDNDIKIYLSWDTNRTDVDLWVTTPKGEKVWYQKRKSSDGASLYDDVTSGYGPESFTVTDAKKGQYRVQVNYYGTSRQRFVEARGEVVVVLDEGRPTERQQVLPYVLKKPSQTITVANIEVK